MSVTDADRFQDADESRNAVLEAELEAVIEDALHGPGREDLAQIFGASTNEELIARTTLLFLRRTAYCCDLCDRIFTRGDIVFRRWGGSSSEGGRMLLPFCEQCVRERFHPSWWKRRREPVACAGGCGVLVTHPYSGAFRTCSERCTTIAASERRHVHRASRKCEACGEEFEPARADARYCSSRCRQLALPGASEARGGGMTSPPRPIRVGCPGCGHEYDDWYRPSLNLDLDDFDEDYVREATTGTCPGASRAAPSTSCTAASHR